MDLTSPNTISAFDILRRRLMMPEQWSASEPLLAANRQSDRMLDALREHWPEYLMEGAELGLFMISACAFTVLLYHPASVVAQNIHSEIFRRMLMGVAMGSTAIALIFSPLGKRSGGHFNPSVTLTFFRLGKIKPWDAAFYALFQFAGAVAGVLIASLTLGQLVSHMSVNYAATVPGRAGAGALVAAYIPIEAPISGMSMNPARTLGSAFGAHVWNSLWIYFTAPPMGMLLAAEAFRPVKAGRAVGCA